MTDQPAVRLVFVSYAHSDRDLVERLIGDLESRQVDVWIDHDQLKPGTPDWEEAVRAAIRSAEAVLLVASQSSRESRYVRDELRIAEMYQRRLFPVWVSGDQFIDSVPMGFGSIQYVDLRGPHYQEGLDQIVQALRGAVDLTVVPVRSQEPDFEPRNPYKSLRPFRSADAGDFFGRSAVVAEMVQQMAAGPADTADKRVGLLTVAGPSGAGKSSVVMAGLLPQLQGGALPGSQTWVFLDPITPGSRPLEMLTETLVRATGRTFTSIRQDLDDESALGLDRLTRLLVKQPDSRTVLLVDQFEELFSPAVAEDERRHFIDLLLAAITQSGPLIALLTIRADFYDRIMPYAALWDAVRAHTFFLAPMSSGELREAIEGPAALPDVRLTFDPDLVGDLLFDVSGQAGALPLLEFTLDQLFERRDGHRLTMSAYREIGGVRGALSNRAESIFHNLPSDEHRRLARSLFLRLIDPGPTEQDTIRRRAALAEMTLPDPHQTAMVQQDIEAFVGARLLTTSRHGEKTAIEVSHEALIREWPRLADWLREARDDIRLQQNVSSDTLSWIEHGYSADYLYRGTALDEAQAWAQRNTPSADESAFLAAASEERARLVSEEQERRQRELVLARRAATRLRALVGVLAGALVVAAVLTGLALISRAAAVRSQAAAIAAANVALSDQLATQAMNLVKNQPQLALLLSVQANRVAPTTDARYSLIDTVESYPNLEAILPGHGSGGANAVAFSPDGRTLAVSDDNDTIALWNVATRRRRRVLSDGNGVDGVAFAPDDSSVAYATDEGTVIVRKTTGSRIATLHSPAVMVNAAFNSDGSIVAGLGTENSIPLWNLATRRRITTLRGSDIAFNPRQPLTAVVRPSGRVSFWNLAQRRYIGSLPAANLTGPIAFSPDGHAIAIGTGDNSITIWNVARRQRLSTIHPRGSVSATAFAAGGRILVTIAGDGSIDLWSALGDPHLLSTMGARVGMPVSAAINRNGTTLAVAYDDGKVALWNVAGETRTLRAPAIANGLAYAPTGATLATVDLDGNVTLWNTRTQRQTGSFRLGDEGESIAYSQDGRLLAAANNNGRVTLWNTATHRISGDLIGRRNELITDVAFDPKGTALAVADDNDQRNSTVDIWNVAARKLVRHITFQDGTEHMNGIAFAPQAPLLAGGGESGRVTIWNTSTYRVQRILDAAGTEQGPINDLTFNRRGTLLAAAADNGTITVWRVATWQRVVTLNDETSSVNSVAFSARGNILAGANEGGTISLWDVDGWKPIAPPLDDHTDDTYAIAFDVHGLSLAAANDNGTISLWSLNPRTWEAEACTIAGRDLTRGEWRQYLGSRPYRATCPGSA